MTVVSKNSTLDSSLGIPGSWTLLDSSVCCIPDSTGKSYPESALLYMGRIICEISCQTALRFLAVYSKGLMTTHKWKFHSYLNADNDIAKNNRLD